MIRRVFITHNLNNLLMVLVDALCSSGFISTRRVFSRIRGIQSFRFILIYPVDIMVPVWRGIN
jgi:hypothetical protein